MIILRDQLLLSFTPTPGQTALLSACFVRHVDCFLLRLLPTSSTLLLTSLCPTNERCLTLEVTHLPSFHAFHAFCFFWCTLTIPGDVSRELRSLRTRSFVYLSQFAWMRHLYNHFKWVASRVVLTGLLGDAKSNDQHGHGATTNNQ